MSLFDYTNPNRLAQYKRALRRGDPTYPLSADFFCQRCEQPHEWCECAETTQ